MVLACALPTDKGPPALPPLFPEMLPQEPYTPPRGPWVQPLLLYLWGLYPEADTVPMEMLPDGQPPKATPPLLLCLRSTLGGQKTVTRGPGVGHSTLAP